MIEKLPTGITGFDQISYGGLPKGRTTLVSGTAGSAKTVFVTQFLAEGIRQRGEHGVFVTFEETPDDIRSNMVSLGWNIPEWEAAGKWAFVDVSPEPDMDSIFTGNYDLGALVARIEHAARKVDAKRLAMDSIGAIFTQFTDASIVRREMLRVALGLKKLGVTSLMTAERIDEYGEIARYGVEEFVADNVIILRNALEGEKRRRTMEILKYRGASHQKGEVPFIIRSGEGVVVLPLSAMELKHAASNERTTAGLSELDAMCGGGFFRDTIALVSGAPGTGKTLLGTTFLAGGAAIGERVLLFAFEESRGQMVRNAAAWGFDLAEMERAGRLQIVSAYPEVRGVEDHLVEMRRIIETFQPQRVVVDSLTALERIAGTTGFREFVIGLMATLRQKEITAVFTATSPSLEGGEALPQVHLATLTDSILLLRYIEFYGEMRRGLTVLKMRGSAHDRETREYEISREGLQIGQPLKAHTNLLAGRTV